MGEISDAIISQLSKGISEVIKTEFGPQNQPLITAALNTAQQAESIVSELSSFQFGIDGYSNVKDVVNKAAQQVENDFAITGIKTKLNDMFAKMRSFSGDHSHNEDEELLSIFKNKKIEMTEEMATELSNILMQYFNLSKDVANINKQIRQNADFQKIQTKANQVMQQGYQILTQIGEAITGTSIVYEVQLSIGSQGAQRTAYMTLEEIMQYTYTEYHRGTMTLRLNESAINAAASQGKVNVFNWNDTYRQSFMQYATTVRENQTRTIVRDGAEISLQNWKRNSNIGATGNVYTNRGNIAEAFRRAAAEIVDTAMDKAFTHQLQELEGMEDTQELHYLIHTQIKSTLENTTAFWQGPDFTADISRIFNGLVMDEQQRQQLLNNLGIVEGTNSVGIQEKISGASFTTLTQIASELRRAANSLNIIANSTNEGNITSAINPGIAAGADEEVEQAVLNLAAQFLGFG